MGNRERDMEEFNLETIKDLENIVVDKTTWIAILKNKDMKSFRVFATGGTEGVPTGCYQGCRALAIVLSRIMGRRAVEIDYGQSILFRMIKSPKNRAVHIKTK